MTKQERVDAAWEDYQAIREPAWKAYQAIIEPAYEVYQSIREPAYEAYLAELDRTDNEPDEDIIEVDGKRYQLIK